MPSRNHLTLFAATILTLAFTAGTATGSTYAWSKPQAVAAVKATRIWKDTAPLAGTVSPLQVAAVTRATLYGHAGKVAGKVVAARWDMTVTLQNHVPEAVISPSKTIPAHVVTTTERFCLTAMSPFRAARSVFRINGWAYNTVNGGCAHASQFDSGGSATYTP